MEQHILTIYTNLVRFILRFLYKRLYFSTKLWLYNKKNFTTRKQYIQIHNYPKRQSIWTYNSPIFGELHQLKTLSMTC